MKKKSLTTVISLVMIFAVILVVALTSSIRTNLDEKVSFTTTAYVRDIPADSPIDSEGHVIPNIQDLDLPSDKIDLENAYYSAVCNDGSCLVSTDNGSIFFEPVGKKATVTIEASGPEDITTDFKISHVADRSEGLTLAVDNGEIVLYGEKLFSASVASNNSFSVTLDTLNDSAFDIDLSPIPAKHMTPGDYLLFAVALILMTIRDAKSYDERQQASRGQAAMISFIVSIVCCFAIGIISKCAPDFPLSIYEATIIPTIVGIVTFAMIADINDAFVGYNGGRGKYIILTWLLTILAVLSAVVPHVKSKAGGDLSRSALLFAACFGAFAVEMTIKTIKDRKGAQEDEES